MATTYTSVAIYKPGTALFPGGVGGPLMMETFEYREPPIVPDIPRPPLPTDKSSLAWSNDPDVQAEQAAILGY